MLELRNKTPLNAVIAPAMDKDGNEFIIVVVKATFNINAASDNLILADEQLPAVMADEYLGEPNGSSLKLASDTAMIKSGTDILLQGQAYNPGGKPYVETYLKVGPVAKQIRVYGNRHWEKLYGGWRISPPEYFDTLPLIYENAFGGVEQSDTEASKKFEDRNPVGKGFYSLQDDRGLEDFPVPNLEDPRQMMSNWQDRFAPTCYAPIAPHWAPRKNHAGTYDAEWEKNRKPFLPADFNISYFSQAPRDLIAPNFLQGGEAVEYRNMSASGFARFTLPQLRFKLRYSIKHISHDAPDLKLDTVLIRPDDSQLQLTWRCQIPCNRHFLYCDWISVRTI